MRKNKKENGEGEGALKKKPGVVFKGLPPIRSVLGETGQWNAAGKFACCSKRRPVRSVYFSGVCLPALSQRRGVFTPLVDTNDCHACF